MDILSAEQINGCLIELGAQLVSFVGARDVAHGDFDAADYRLDIDCWRRGKRAHVARTRRALPFLLSLLGAFRRGLSDLFLNGIYDGIGILPGGKNNLQFVPQPLSGSRKIKVMAFNRKTIREGHAPSGRVASVGPVAGLE